MFFDLYYKNIVIKDFYFKLNIIIKIIFYGYLYLQFIDFLKYDIYIFSRCFRNIRYTFFFFTYFIKIKLRKYLKKRKSLFLINLIFYNLNNLFFFFLIEYLLLYIYRLFFKYNLKFLVFNMQKKNLINYKWHDIYINLIDLNDLIFHREEFIFKFDLPKIVYSMYIYINIYSLLILSFIGFKFFKNKYRYIFKFYTKII
jgi:hypothetical protein